MTDTYPTRVESLDLLRGLAVAGMIVVNSPGDWSKIYWPLDHAAWHGWTPTDLVFPLFLFAVGMALGLSFPRALAAPGARAAFWLRLARRAAALILLGLFLGWMSILAHSLSAPASGTGDPSGLRFPGILQRIALCYALAALLLVTTAAKDEQGRSAIRAWAIAAIIALILLVYWVLLTFVPVPGYGAGRLDPEGSLPAWLDRLVFTPRHMWRLGSATGRGPATYDPEGLLSSLTATVNVLFGVLAGREWRRPTGPRLGLVLAASALLVVAGLLLDPLVPINKRLWTSSFALLGSGFAGLALVAVHALARGGFASRLLTPLRILGANAILAFTLSVLLGILSGIRFLGAPGMISPQGWGNAIANRLIPDPYLASLACAVAILAVITFALWPLHSRAIRFRL